MRPPVTETSRVKHELMSADHTAGGASAWAECANLKWPHVEGLIPANDATPSVEVVVGELPA